MSTIRPEHLDPEASYCSVPAAVLFRQEPEDDEDEEDEKKGDDTEDENDHEDDDGYSEGVYKTVDFPGAAITPAYGVNSSDDVVGFYFDSGGRIPWLPARPQPVKGERLVVLRLWETEDTLNSDRSDDLREKDHT